VAADLGLAPWSVMLDQGIFQQQQKATGIPIGDL
jgi:hypothetical protein